MGGLEPGGLKPGGLNELSTDLGALDPLTHQWRMDEGSGSTLNADIGSVDATLDGTWAADSNGEGGYHTDYNNGNSDDWVSDAAVGLDGSEMTMLVWINLDTFSSSNHRVYCYGNSSDYNVLEIVTTGNGFKIYYYESGNFNDPGISVDGLSTGTWYLLGFVGESDNTATLYVFDSSSLVGSSTGSIDRGFLPDDKIRGMSRRGGGSYADGQMDAPALSNDTAMSQIQIEDYRNITR